MTDIVIYTLGYAFIIYLTYNVAFFYIENTRIRKVSSASSKEKLIHYLFGFFFAALVAAMFSIRATHRLERYIAAFILLLFPALAGIYKGYWQDDKLTNEERQQRRELRDIRGNDNRDI